MVWVAAEEALSVVGAGEGLLLGGFFGFEFAAGVGVIAGTYIGLVTVANMIYIYIDRDGVEGKKKKETREKEVR